MRNAALALVGSPETVRSDADLVASIAIGNLDDLGILFDRHEADVRRLLSRLGVSSFDLDDLVQQTFLDVPHASARFREGAPVRPWLFGLATIRVRRRRRSLSRASTHLEAWAREPPARAVVTPADQCELTDEARRAWDALKALPPKKREAFVLVALEGMTCVEAASTLGVPVATIWTRIHYARATLRRVLGVAGVILLGITARHLYPHATPSVTPDRFTEPAPSALPVASTPLPVTSSSVMPPPTPPHRSSAPRPAPHPGPGASFDEGVANFERGAYETADTQLERFVHDYPSDNRAEDAAYLRAVARLRLGDREGAAARARDYLERYPTGFRRMEAQRIVRGVRP